MNIISEKANALLTRKPPTSKNNDCEEEVAEIIANIQLALIQNNTEEIEVLTKLLKKTSRELKTAKMIANFQNDKWDPINMYKK
eukprot:1044540-Heterocapsa_arctica.AAC.1